MGVWVHHDASTIEVLVGMVFQEVLQRLRSWCMDCFLVPLELVIIPVIHDVVVFLEWSSKITVYGLHQVCVHAVTIDTCGGLQIVEIVKWIYMGDWFKWLHSLAIWKLDNKVGQVNCSETGTMDGLVTMPGCGVVTSTTYRVAIPMNLVILAPWVHYLSRGSDSSKRTNIQTTM